jgi:hypothetical protein
MKVKKLHTAITSFLMLAFIFVTNLGNVNAQTGNIKNDIFWNTKDGQPLNSQGGGIFKFADPKTGMQKYFWYGVQYEEANMYRNAPYITLPNATFKSVTCYSSVDLVNWTFEGDVVTKEEANKSGKTWVGRLGVAYMKELNKYAMFVQHGSEVLITLSNSPNRTIYLASKNKYGENDRNQ